MPPKKPPTPHGGRKKGPWSRRIKSITKVSTALLIEESDTPFTEIVAETKATTTENSAQISGVSAVDPCEPEVLGNYFSSSLHMLPEDHPSFNHMNRLVDIFEDIRNAFTMLQSSPSVEKRDIKKMQRCLDSFDDTLNEMDIIESAGDV